MTVTELKLQKEIDLATNLIGQQTEEIKELKKSQRIILMKFAKWWTTPICELTEDEVESDVDLFIKQEATK